MRFIPLNNKNNKSKTYSMNECPSPLSLCLLSIHSAHHCSHVNLRKRLFYSFLSPSLPPFLPSSLPSFKCLSPHLQSCGLCVCGCMCVCGCVPTQRSSSRKVLSIQRSNLYPFSFIVPTIRNPNDFARWILASLSSLILPIMSFSLDMLELFDGKSEEEEGGK